jgi:hypothetical protein
MRSHGHARNRTQTPEYRAWQKMKLRCSNPNEQNYRYYGGRGIRVAAEWENDFEAFLAYIGDRPSASHSLDRIDCDGDYRPGNVRWATRQEQTRNTRRNHWIEINGERMTIAEAAERLGLKPSTLANRVNLGFTGDDLISPAHATRRRPRSEIPKRERPQDLMKQKGVI